MAETAPAPAASITARRDGASARGDAAVWAEESLRRVGGLVGSRLAAWWRKAAPAPAEEEEDADVERRRIRDQAQLLGTKPILHEDDLKYEGMQPLGDSKLLEWVRRGAADKLAVRIKHRSLGDGDVDQAPVLAWIITADPAAAEVDAGRTLLEMKGWEVHVKPATKALVKSAVLRDQALSPTDVEREFRDLLRDALARNASDIHFELRDDGERGITRFRVNGEMEEVRRDEYPRFTGEVVKQFGNYMFNRLAKRGARQFDMKTALNASAQMKVGDQTVALRFSTAPDIRGVDIFVRVWRPDQKALGLAELGYRDDQIDLLSRSIDRPYGVIVFSGPTGSGKSSSLTALLDDLEEDEKERRKVVSLEEPVERELTHVTHVAVNDIVEQAGWKTLLGGLNRWDSNINVLGEIKDEATAEAIEDLATSGKLSLTTVHAANVLSIPSRLEDLGVDHRLLYDPNFLVLLVNQRLVPQLCSQCSVLLGDDAGLVEKLAAREADIKSRYADAPHCQDALQRARRDFEHDIGRLRSILRGRDAVRLRGLGCDAEGCSRTGIVGRVLVAEMVLLDDDSRDFIKTREWDGWRRWLRERGWVSIKDHALEHVLAGAVDPVDIERLVCPLDDDGPAAEPRQAAGGL